MFAYSSISYGNSSSRQSQCISKTTALHQRAHHGARQAIELYQKMRCSSVKPDGHVFVAALQACSSAADSESGRQVHCDVMECRVEPDLFVWTCLVDMYEKCGRLEDARTIFDSLVTKNVVTWNTMIAGHAKHEQGQEALSLYKQTELEGVVLADPVTFSCLLKACATLGALQKGKELHSQILERGLASDIFVGSSLADMYAKCGRLEEARSVFDKALDVLQHMDRHGCVASANIRRSLLKACTYRKDLLQAKQIQAHLTKHGLESTKSLGEYVMSTLVKCGSLRDALGSDQLPCISDGICSQSTKRPQLLHDCYMIWENEGRSLGSLQETQQGSRIRRLARENQINTIKPRRQPTI